MWLASVVFTAVAVVWTLAAVSALWTGEAEVLKYATALMLPVVGYLGARAGISSIRVIRNGEDEGERRRR